MSGEHNDQRAPTAPKTPPEPIVISSDSDPDSDSDYDPDADSDSDSEVEYQRTLPRVATNSDPNANRRPGALSQVVGEAPSTREARRMDAQRDTPTTPFTGAPSDGPGGSGSPQFLAQLRQAQPKLPSHSFSQPQAPSLVRPEAAVPKPATLQPAIQSAAVSPAAIRPISTRPAAVQSVAPQNSSASSFPQPQSASSSPPMEPANLGPPLAARRRGTNLRSILFVPNPLRRPTNRPFSGVHGPYGSLIDDLLAEPSTETLMEPSTEPLVEPWMELSDDSQVDTSTDEDSTSESFKDPIEAPLVDPGAAPGCKTPKPNAQADTLTSDPILTNMPPQDASGQAVDKSAKPDHPSALLMGSNTRPASSRFALSVAAAAAAAAAPASDDDIARPADWPKNCFSSLEPYLRLRKDCMSDLELVYMLGVQAGIGHGITANRGNLVAEIARTGKVMGLDVKFHKYPKHWINSPVETLQLTSEPFDVTAAKKAASNFVEVRHKVGGTTMDFATAHRTGVDYLANGDYGLSYQVAGSMKGEVIGNQQELLGVFLENERQREMQQAASMGNYPTAASGDYTANNTDYFSVPSGHNPSTGGTGNGSVTGTKRTYSMSQVGSPESVQAEPSAFNPGPGFGAGLGYGFPMTLGGGDPNAYSSGANNNQPVSTPMRPAGAAFLGHGQFSATTHPASSSGVNIPTTPAAPFGQASTPASSKKARKEKSEK